MQKCCPDDNAKSDLTKNKIAMSIWLLSGILIIGSIFIKSEYQPLTAFSGFVIAGVLCILNALQCKRFHCIFTGPLFLILAIVSILCLIPYGIIVAIFIIGVLIFHIPEWLGKKYL